MPTSRSPTARISFHQVAHVVFDANGIVRVEFDKLKAHCG
jgi:hypothetical protein